MDDPQLLLEIGRMDDQEIVRLITQLRQENERLRALLHDIRAFHAGHSGLNAANYWPTIEERIDAALDGLKAI